MDDLPEPEVLKGWPLNADGTRADDIIKVARAHEMRRQGTHVTAIMEEFRWGHRKTRRVLDSPPPPQRVLQFLNGSSEEQLADFWRSPLVRPSRHRRYATRWSDPRALAVAYADWAEQHGREPKPSDWEEADPDRERPTRRTVDNRTNWRYLTEAGRDELRRRGRDDLIDG